MTEKITVPKSYIPTRHGKSIMKELSFDDFRKKHRGEYEELLVRLSLTSLERVVLKVSGIKSLRIFSIGNLCYFSCLTDANVNQCTKEEAFGDKALAKGVERFLLNVTICRRMDESKLEEDYDETFIEHIEYAIAIRERTAYFGLVSMEKSQLAKNLIVIFLITIGKLTNIDAFNIVVPSNDTLFLEALELSGFTKGEDHSGCYHVKKSLT